MKRIPFSTHEKSKYWDYEKNTKTPKDVSYGSNSKHWFICPDCNHSIYRTVNGVVFGHWCKYCSKKCCVCDDENCKFCFNISIASLEKSKYWDYEKNKENPKTIINVSTHTEKYWFKCDICNHSYLQNVVNMFKCNYCFQNEICNDTCCSCKTRLLSMTPLTKYWDYESNKENPNNILIQSGTPYSFYCNNKNHIFQSTIKKAKYYNCIECMNEYERILYSHLNTHPNSRIIIFNYKELKDPKTNKWIPFTFILKRSHYKIVIEIDGDQHFKHKRGNKKWKIPFERQYERDCLKIKHARTKVYSILRFYYKDIINDDINWQIHLNKFRNSTEKEVYIINNTKFTNFDDYINYQEP